MRATALALLALCTACTQAQYVATVNSGTVVHTSSSQVRIDTASPFGIALLAATIAAAVSGDFGEAPASSGLMEPIWRLPPPMNPDRAVAEQDCTKPIELTGNLRCR
ncbi:MAG TPA: hypothetical protein VFJ70_13185 [Burkholderiales bacterium]|nr:hypothetical protein [Burkholderiales bacterium]